MTDYKNDIWQYLKTHTALPDEAIAGIMGNFEAESNCEPCRLQGDFSADRALSKAYAAKVDSGDLYKFTSGFYGFGLAQWTYPTRCQNLYNFCNQVGEPKRSVADLDAQLDFCILEMQTEYASMWKQLLNCTDIIKATELVVKEYERPAQINLDTRVKFAREIYNSFHSAVVADEKEAIKAQIRELLEKL